MNFCMLRTKKKKKTQLEIVFGQSLSPIVSEYFLLFGFLKVLLDGTHVVPAGNCIQSLLKCHLSAAQPWMNLCSLAETPWFNKRLQPSKMPCFTWPTCG